MRETGLAVVLTSAFMLLKPLHKCHIVLSFTYSGPYIWKTSSIIINNVIEQDRPIKLKDKSENF